MTVTMATSNYSCDSMWHETPLTHLFWRKWAGIKLYIYHKLSTHLYNEWHAVMFCSWRCFSWKCNCWMSCPYDPSFPDREQRDLANYKEWSLILTERIRANMMSSFLWARCRWVTFQFTSIMYRSLIASVKDYIISYERQIWCVIQPDSVALLTTKQ